MVTAVSPPPFDTPLPSFDEEPTAEPLPFP
jgi:hypothetical protein